MSLQTTEPLKRLAIFVEGKTEMLFIEKLVIEIAGRHNVVIETRVISGGSTVPRSYVTLKAGTTAVGGAKYFILIVDCQGDQQVKTRIKEEHSNLTKEGYSKIIGIRDVYPDFSRNEIPRLQLGLAMYLSTKLAPVEFVLSTMEIEAWFLAEAEHFKLIDASMDVETIKQKTSIDLLADLTLLPNPAATLKKIYDVAGIEYKKGEEFTINNLDYAVIYTELPNRIESIGKLVKSLDEFLDD